MLRKTILTLGLLVFAFGVLFASVWRTSAQSLQKTEPVPEATGVALETTGEGKKEKVEYALPWPGLLPDHFLYPIKMVRDRIWLMLTTDSLKKEELLLRLADKRVWSAQLLLEKGKQDLAVTTATKAEKYLEQAIGQVKIAKEKGEETAAFLEKLSQATLKHEEILLEINERIDEKARPVIQELIDYTQRAQEELRKMMGS